MAFLDDIQYKDPTLCRSGSKDGHEIKPDATINLPPANKDILTITDFGNSRVVQRLKMNDENTRRRAVLHR